jgi:hypothetical protein
MATTLSSFSPAAESAFAVSGKSSSIASCCAGRNRTCWSIHARSSFGEIGLLERGVGLLLVGHRVEERVLCDEERVLDGAVLVLLRNGREDRRVLDQDAALREEVARLLGEPAEPKPVGDVARLLADRGRDLVDLQAAFQEPPVSGRLVERRCRFSIVWTSSTCSSSISE